MRSNLLKRASAAGLIIFALASCSTTGGEGPIFATAAPVAAAKPDNFGFKGAIRVGNLQGLSKPLKRNAKTVLYAKDFTNSLRRSLANDEMLAPKGTKAEYELTPYFVELRTAPVGDGVTAAQAVFQYRVVRTSDNTVVLNKRIKADYSSVADPKFGGPGLFGRTLRFVGLVKDHAKPVGGDFANKEETRGPGPRGKSAREVHAARHAIALNIRMAMRHLIVASPERIVAAPQQTSAGAAASQAGDAVPAQAKKSEPATAVEDKATPDKKEEAAAKTKDTATPGKTEDAGSGEEDKSGADDEDDAVPVTNGKPMPPVAPAQDDAGKGDGQNG